MHPPLVNLGLVDLLQGDPRASFVVALPETNDVPSPSDIVYQNPALSGNPLLLDRLLTASASPEYDSFWHWIRGLAPDTSSSFLFLGLLWTRIGLQSKWVALSCNDMAPADGLSNLRLDALDRLSPASTLQARTSAPSTPSVASDTHAKALTKPAANRVASEPGLKLADVTVDRGPFIETIEGIDWSSTPLGPMDMWPPMLQQSYSQLLCISQPAAIYWGDDFTTIYNEAFGELIGPRHPSLLGRPMKDVFPDMAPQIRRLMDISVKRQRASNQDETRLFVETGNGPPLETYLKWSIVPIMQDDRCLGFIHPITETTMYQLFRRRVKMLVNMGEVLGTAKDVKSFWSSVIRELEDCEPSYDIPLAFLYSVEKDGRQPTDLSKKVESKYECLRVCHLEGVLGVPKGHSIAPQYLRLSDTDEGLAAQFRKAIQSRKPLLISTSDGSLPQNLLRGIQWRGFGDPCDAAVVVPIRPTKDEEDMGLLVLGLNPRRPYDDAYKLYIQLLSQKLASFLACTVLLEEERRRGRSAAEQAAFDQALLKEKLAYQTKEAIEYTRLFQTVSEFIPNGFSIGDHQGNIKFANQLWYRITGHPQGELSPEAFLSCVVEEDRHKIHNAYEQLKTTDEVEFELRIRQKGESPGERLKSPFEDPRLDFGSRHDDSMRHVIAQAKAERAGDGTIIRTFTCLTDVTMHRRTAETALQRAQEAGNLKRMAELATVGMFDMEMSGQLLGANNVFYDICGIPKVNPAQIAVRPWAQSVVKDDLQRLHECIEELRRKATPQSVEVRMKTTWIAQDSAGNNITAPRWVNATFMPVKNSEGVVSSFTGCLSDVSMSKWQLELETGRKEEAIESKRLQDNFIDMTSHEMRNPLSAILHSTDAIIASLTMGQELVDELPDAGKATSVDGCEDEQPDITSLIKDSIANAEIIVACAQHQKRIVDDILTMSKLDSKLLAVTPCTVSPVQIGREAVKMFDVEARRVDIDLTMNVDPSFTALGHEYLDLDPSRVKQVLINLLTNALKFTKSGSTRTVAVSIKGSTKRPTDKTSAVTFIPRFVDEQAEYKQPDLDERRDPVYLMFEVTDSGQGLTDEEKANLFNRFVQASARTHVKYGGSGLGLFISRRLTELQKGAIGVSSQPGVGSTFAFFIEAYIPSKAAREEAEAQAAALRTASNQVARMPMMPGSKGRTPSINQRFKSGQHSVPISGVLVVEDNLINQQLTRRGLTDRGFAVEVANHGVEALEKLTRSASVHVQNMSIPEGQAGSDTPLPGPGSPIPISLILMDIEMPIQDGLTCTREIRGLESQGKVYCANGGRIPIIAVSANARPEQVQQALMTGCDDVLVKPYHMSELVEKMHVVVKQMARRASVAASTRSSIGHGEGVPACRPGPSSKE